MGATQYVRIIYLMLNGNELQDVLGQYSRSALSLDDDFLLAWEIPPRWGESGEISGWIC